jgi:hypothetical protein
LNKVENVSKKFQYFKNFKKLQNFHKISKHIFHKIKKNQKKKSKFSKFVYHESDIFHKIGSTEIPYINKGLLVYLVFSMGMGVNIPMVYRPPYS